METVALRADELEALRLADLEGLYQEDSAQRMGISRTTLSRTLAEARRKVADALLNGKRLVVEPVRAIGMAERGRAASGFLPVEPGEATQALGEASLQSADDPS